MEYIVLVYDTDDNLIDSYKKGESNSLRLLIDKYTDSIYNFSARFVGQDEAYDITQEAFIKAWKNLKRFDKDKSSFKTWIFTIARNTCTDYLRKKKNINFSSLDKDDYDFADDIIDEGLLPSELAVRLEDTEFLNKLLLQLKEEERVVLTLYYQDEMTFKEIGEVLDRPLNTVKSIYRRSLLKLKEMTGGGVHQINN